MGFLKLHASRVVALPLLALGLVLALVSFSAQPAIAGTSAKSRIAMPSGFVSDPDYSLFWTGSDSEWDCPGYDCEITGVAVAISKSHPNSVIVISQMDADTYGTMTAFDGSVALFIDVPGGQQWEYGIITHSTSYSLGVSQDSLILHDDGADWSATGLTGTITRGGDYWAFDIPWKTLDLDTARFQVLVTNEFDDTDIAPANGTPNLPIAASAKPEPSPPGSPKITSLVAGPQNVTVAWDPPVSNGGSPVTRYVVTATPGGQRCRTAGPTHCTVGGLVAGSAYTFTVSAANRIGTSRESRASRAVKPQLSAEVPGRIVVVSAQPVSGGVKITWQTPAGSPAAQTTYQYRIDRGPWVGVRGPGTNLGGLKRGRDITVEIRAVNAVGFGPSIKVHTHAG